MTSPLSEGHWPLEFILGEIDPNSIDEITIGASQTLVPGQVVGLAKAKMGAVTVGAPAFTGTGNGVLTRASPAYGAGVQNGTYTIRLIEAGADAGNFEVIRPDGTIDGIAVVAVAYTGQVKFTIADGATDFSNSAQFTLAVSIADPTEVNHYLAHDAAATDGSQVAAAIVCYPVVTGVSETKTVAAVMRNQAVKGPELTWKSGISGSDKTAGVAALAANMVIVRNP